MSDTPQTGWTSGSRESFSDLPIDTEKEAAFRKRQEESKVLVDAAIAPLVEEYENAPDVEPEDDRDLEETIHDLFADRQTLDRKARAQRLKRMAARGRDEFNRPLPQSETYGMSPEALAYLEAELEADDD